MEREASRSIGGGDRPRRQDRGRASTRDANEVLCQFESSYDYDPAPVLAAITGSMLTINFADDLLNPVELLHLPQASNVTCVMLPALPNSYGHETLIHAATWAPVLEAFLATLPAWQKAQR